MSYINKSTRMLNAIQEADNGATDCEVMAKWDNSSFVMFRLLYNSDSDTFIMGPEPSYVPEYEYQSRLIDKFFIQKFHRINYETYGEWYNDVLQCWEEMCEQIDKNNMRDITQELYWDIAQCLDDKEGIWEIVGWQSKTNGVNKCYCVELDVAEKNMKLLCGLEGKAKKVISAFEFDPHTKLTRQISSACIWINNAKRKNPSNVK